MNVNFRSVNEFDVRRFQEGGPMPGGLDPNAMPPQGAPEGAPEGGAPAPEGGELGGDDQLQGMAQLLVDMLMQQIGDPDAVADVLEMALDMVQGGGEEPAPEPQGEPVYRRGGRLLCRLYN